jgi:anthraniloyl-CoA monooxygenase
LEPGSSDEGALRLLQLAFAEILGPARLIGNRSQWRAFRTVRLERWHEAGVVLLGDAAHTAHYSLGSGTKIAMEDSIALAEALTEEPDERTAFVRYEAARRPPVSRLQHISRRSQLWWETFPRRAHLPPRQLALAFLTRTGNVGFDEVEEHDPEVLAAAASSYGAEGHSREAILGRPLEHARRTLGGRLIGAGIGPWQSACPIVGLDRAAEADVDPPFVRVDDPEDAATARDRFPESLLTVALDVDGIDAWGATGDAAVAAVRRWLTTTGCDGVHLEGAARGRNALLDRLELAERLRLEADGLVSVSCPIQYVDDGIIAIAAGRVDLITPEENVKEGAPYECQAA